MHFECNNLAEMMPAWESFAMTECTRGNPLSSLVSEHSTNLHAIPIYREASVISVATSIEGETLFGTCHHKYDFYGIIL